MTRDLDREVAKKVMRLALVTDYTGELNSYSASGKRLTIPNYSTKADDAFLVVAYMKATGHAYSIGKANGGEWRVAFSLNEKTWFATAKTIPEAICRAALATTVVPTNTVKFQPLSPR